MSLNLYYAPVLPQDANNLGGHPVKGLLVRAFGEGDGSLHTEFQLTKGDLPALEMLLRTNGEGPGEVAKEIREGLCEVIDAVGRYGAIRCFTDD